MSRENPERESKEVSEIKDAKSFDELYEILYAHDEEMLTKFGGGAEWIVAKTKESIAELDENNLDRVFDVSAIGNEEVEQKVTELLKKRQEEKLEKKEGAK